MAAFSVPISEVSESSLEDGYGFDGSSIRGWQAINLSDMLVIPDPNSANMDPFTEIPTLTMICDVLEPDHARTLFAAIRAILPKKRRHFLGKQGWLIPPISAPNSSSLSSMTSATISTRTAGIISSTPSRGWNSGREESPTWDTSHDLKRLLPVSPTDTLQDLRTEMVLTLEKVGIIVEAQHHEVATAGQCEIDMRFSPLTQMADKVMWYKYIIKNVARRHSKTATFMPKPIFGDNGTGMRTSKPVEERSAVVPRQRLCRFE